MAEESNKDIQTRESTAKHPHAPSIEGLEELEKRIRWFETDQMDHDRDGVEFRHQEFKAARESREEFTDCIAFVDGYSWLKGGDIVIRLQTRRPPLIAEARWLRIRQSVKDGVFAFLMDKSKANGSFRHGPVSVWFNA